MKISKLESKNTSVNTTSILLFSRTAKEEAAIKNFHLDIGAKGNISIAKKLIEHSVSTFNQTGLAVFTCFSTQQIGDSFGERLANAIEAVFNRGFDNVIVLGNDCPSLTRKSILDAEKLLLTNDLVLGPATDGGVYLIAIKKTAYYRQSFIELPWEKSDLQNGWKSYGNTINLSINWLHNETDIDTATDFKNLLSSLSNNNRLKKYLIRIINSFRYKKTTNQFCFYTVKQITHLPSRAPPIH